MIDYIELCRNLLVILDDVSVSGVDNANKILLIAQGLNLLKKHLEGDDEDGQSDAAVREDL